MRDNTNTPKYRIYGYDQIAVNRTGGRLQEITGWSAEREAENLKDAKRQALYLLSENYRLMGEMSEPLAYAEVQDRNDDCILEFWNPNATCPDIEREEEVA